MKPFILVGLLGVALATAVQAQGAFGVAVSFDQTRLKVPSVKPAGVALPVVFDGRSYSFFIMAEGAYGQLRFSHGNADVLSGTEAGVLRQWTFGMEFGLQAPLPDTPVLVAVPLAFNFHGLDGRFEGAMASMSAGAEATLILGGDGGLFPVAPFVRGTIYLGLDMGANDYSQDDIDLRFGEAGLLSGGSLSVGVRAFIPVGQ